MIGRDVVHQKNLHWKSTINNYLTSELNRFKSVIRIYSHLTNQRVILINDKKWNFNTMDKIGFFPTDV